MIDKRHRQRGAALIIVLWTALLLSMALAAAIAAARIEARIAAVEWTQFELHQAAIAGLEYAAHSIATEEAGSLDRLGAFQFSINGYDLRFAPSVESEKLDLNLASEVILSSFFKALGREPDTADVLAARVADWRDPDDLPRPNGAEARDYVLARNGETIGNRPFYSVDELLLVLDMPPDLVACIAPALTIFGGGGPPSARVMQQIFGTDMNRNSTATGARLGTASRSAAAGRRYAITATVAHAEQPARDFSLTGVFRIIGDRDRPYDWIAQFEETSIDAPRELCIMNSAAGTDFEPK